MNKPGEFELIEKYFAPLAGNAGFALKDDAALIDVSSDDHLVVTQDAIAENVHFFSDDPPELIAKKAVRVNLSDLAAKGAKGQWISLSLGLGDQWTEDWVGQFAKGLAEDCKLYGLELSGGDTFRTGGGFVISITAIGKLTANKYVSRLGAEQGDAIYVTGTIGDAALGLLTHSKKLSLDNNDDSEFLSQRYLLPQPRVEAAAVIGKFASASMDISDGLIGDLDKMCEASALAAEIHADLIPLSQSARNAISTDNALFEKAVTGGDDYEILACVPNGKIAAFESSMNDAGVAASKIGVTKPGKGASLFDLNGEVMELHRLSYDHSGG